MGKAVKLDKNLKSTRCEHPMWNCFQFSKEVLDNARKRGGDMAVYTYDEAIAKWTKQREPDLSMKVQITRP